MRVVLYVAISSDGFIARSNGDSDWVKDDELFESVVYEFGCMALGHNTFKQFEKEIYPVKGVQHLVLAKNAGLDTNYKNVIYVSGPQQAIEKAKDLGFEQLLVIGGGQCNGSFTKAGLLGEVWVDIHSLILGNGIKMLGDFAGELNLKLTSSTQHKNFLHCQYEVVND